MIKDVTQPELIGLAVSPFSDRAKWALKHHGVEYRYSEHLLIFGIPSLRWKLRKPTGDVTVPALIHGEVRLMDSFDIALYAEKIGKGSALFPEGRFEQIRELNNWSEVACDAGRALVMTRVAADREAQAALLPPFVPKPMRSSVTMLAKLGIDYIGKSFNVSAKSIEEREKDLRGILMTMEETLERAGGEYFLGKFSYADITMASALWMVSPPTSHYLWKNPHTRRCWVQPGLVEEFRELIDWRDRLLSKHYS